MDIEAIKNFAVDTMLTYGEIPGGTFMLSGSAGQVDVSVRIPNIPDRHGMIRRIGRRVRKRHSKQIGRLQHVGMVSEVWMAQIDGDEDAFNQRASQHPDRIEAVIAVVLDVQHKKLDFAALEIKRDGHNLELAELDMDQPDEIEAPLIYAFIAGYLEVRA